MNTPPANAPYFRPTHETGRYGLQCPDCREVFEGTAQPLGKPKSAHTKVRTHWVANHHPLLGRTVKVTNPERASFGEQGQVQWIIETVTGVTFARWFDASTNKVVQGSLDDIEVVA